MIITMYIVVMLLVLLIGYRAGKIDGNKKSLERYLEEQMRWSSTMFGRSARTKGTIEHIKKELCEVEREPHDLEEWIDIVMLALDGYWRHGGRPVDVADDLFAKAAIVRERKFPPDISDDKPAEHVRDGYNEPVKTTAVAGTIRYPYRCACGHGFTELSVKLAVDSLTSASMQLESVRGELEKLSKHCHACPSCSAPIAHAKRVEL